MVKVVRYDPTDTRRDADGHPIEDTLSEGGEPLVFASETEAMDYLQAHVLPALSKVHPRKVRPTLRIVPAT